MPWETSCARCREMRDDIAHLGIYSHKGTDPAVKLFLEYTCPCSPGELLYSEASLYYAHFLMRYAGLVMTAWPPDKDLPLSEERVHQVLEATEEDLAPEPPRSPGFRERLRRWFS